MIIDLDYFRSEIVKFRDIMCSRKFTTEQKDDAFYGLAYAYINCKATGDDNKQVITMFDMTRLEWERRRLYEVCGI